MARRENILQAVSDPHLSQFKHHFIVYGIPLPQILPPFLTLLGKAFRAHNPIYILQIAKTHSNRTFDILIGFSRDEDAIFVAKQMRMVQIQGQSYSFDMTAAFRCYMERQLKKEKHAQQKHNYRRVQQKYIMRQDSSRHKYKMILLMVPKQYTIGDIESSFEKHSLLNIEWMRDQIYDAVVIQFKHKQLYEQILLHGCKIKNTEVLAISQDLENIRKNIIFYQYRAIKIAQVSNELEELWRIFNKWSWLQIKQAKVVHMQRIDSSTFIITFSKLVPKSFYHKESNWKIQINNTAVINKPNLEDEWYQFLRNEIKKQKQSCQ